MDLFTLNALATELNETLYGAKIDKIVQPEIDEIRFYLRRKNRNFVLVLSANAKVPRIHITQTKKTNPSNAPAFCMLLRKHLAVGAVEKVSIVNCDRIIKIDFICKSELKDFLNYSIIVELMGRYSNIVFLDGGGKILDAVKKTSLDDERHAVFKGVTYVPPQLPKNSVFSDSFNSHLLNVDFKSYPSITDALISNFSGFTKASWALCLKIAKIDSFLKAVTKKEIDALTKAVGVMKNINSQDIFKPAVQNGEAVCVPDENLPYTPCDSLSEAMEMSLNKLDDEARVQSKTKYLKGAVKRLLERIKKNIATYRQKLADCEFMEQEKITGELIYSNIYKIKKGDETLKAFNYYTSEDEEIALDPTLSPSQNAKKHFDRYAKLKRTKEFLTNRIKEEESLYEYALTIEHAVSNLTASDPTEEIENELFALGALHVKTKRNKIDKPLPPVRYEINGFTLLKGKNNNQNDTVTFKIAKSDDIWLHVKNAPSAHTVILLDGKKIDDGTLKTACEIAASDFTAATTVDFTLRKNVKRKQPYRPGQVYYTDFSSLTVEPNAHEELKVK